MAIKECTCENEYMDKRYGHGKRVHTETKKGLTCVVCGPRSNSNQRMQNCINNWIPPCSLPPASKGPVYK